MVLRPELVAVADAQRGVFTSAQAYAAGHSQKEIQRLRKDHLTSIRRRIYVWREAYQAAAPLEQHGMRVAALTLALTSPGVLSHQTAAAELGLELLDADLTLLHVTRPSCAGSRTEAGVVHHAGELPARHITCRGDGEMSVTTLARRPSTWVSDPIASNACWPLLDSALHQGDDPGRDPGRARPLSRMAGGADAQRCRRDRRWSRRQPR